MILSGMRSRTDRLQRALTAFLRQPVDFCDMLSSRLRNLRQRPVKPYLCDPHWEAELHTHLANRVGSDNNAIAELTAVVVTVPSRVAGCTVYREKIGMTKPYPAMLPTMAGSFPGWRSVPAAHFIAVAVDLGHHLCMSRFGCDECRVRRDYDAPY